MTSPIRWFSTTPIEPATAERAGGAGIRAPIGSSTARRRSQPRCSTPGAAGFARGSTPRSGARAPGNTGKNMHRVVKSSLILAAALGGLAGQAQSARADFVRQVVTYTVSDMIKNPPNANGLVLSFARDKTKVGDAQGVVSFGPNSSLAKPINYRQPVGAKGAVSASEVTSGLNNAPMATAKWAAGTINIKPGDSASIDFQRPNSSDNPHIVGPIIASPAYICIRAAGCLRTPTHSLRRRLSPDLINSLRSLAIDRPTRVPEYPWTSTTPES